MRIDKWLWCVRLFKTRTQAGEACKGGRVKINEQKVKASREIVIGDTIEVQLQNFKKTVKVLDLPKSRVGAKLVEGLMQDITPKEEYEYLDMLKLLKTEKRDRGAGRPTKKERRDIDRLKGE